jgi:transcription elongation factor GreA-like protein
VAGSPVETFAVGDLVTHDKYGLGNVIGVEDETVILVDFATHRLRLPLPCAKLIKL